MGHSLACYCAGSILSAGSLRSVFNPWLSCVSFFGLLAIAPLLPSSAVVYRLMLSARFHEGSRIPDNTTRSGPSL